MNSGGRNKRWFTAEHEVGKTALMKGARRAEGPKGQPRVIVVASASVQFSPPRIFLEAVEVSFTVYVSPYLVVISCCIVSYIFSLRDITRLPDTALDAVLSQRHPRAVKGMRMDLPGYGVQGDQAAAAHVQDGGIQAPVNAKCR